MKQNITIGVFDSGVGGKRVANAIGKAISTARIVYVSDPENVPYGTKTKDQLRPLVQDKLQYLQDQGCEIIVIACNTASVSLIDEMRAMFDVPLVGVEPMLLEAASQTSTNIITVCATPTTLTSDRYRKLKSYNPTLRYIEPDCSGWASMIEAAAVDTRKITRIVKDAMAQGTDTIVLGCTHYHWIEELIIEASGDSIKVLQPEPLIVNTIKEKLSL